MKILIASDLHGSYAHIKQLIDRVDIEKPDRLLLLGDILYHGPRNNLPEEYDTQLSASILNNVSDIITCIRGNCDSEVDQMMLNFSIESPHMILSLDGINIFATHGHLYNTLKLPPMSSIDILLHGHTHIPVLEEISNNKFYMNPGSVSIPKASSSFSYMVYENRKFTWKHLDGSVYMEKIIQ